jgi:hypothetical protein
MKCIRCGSDVDNTLYCDDCTQKIDLACKSGQSAPKTNTCKRCGNLILGREYVPGTKGWCNDCLDAAIAQDKKSKKGRLLQTEAAKKYEGQYHGYVVDLNRQHVEALERCYARTVASADGRDYRIQDYIRAIVWAYIVERDPEYTEE